MKRSQIDSVAEEIYRLCSGEFLDIDALPTFKASGKPCKTFYRKIARWHLAKISRMRPPLKESMRKKFLKGWCTQSACRSWP